MTYTNGTASIAYRMPAETERHAGTMMAWPTVYSMIDEAFSYPGLDASKTRQEIAGIARAIAKYEPLHLFVRDPAFAETKIASEDTNLKTVKELLGNAKNVTIHATPNVHSLWARDTGPVFVRSTTGLVQNVFQQSDDPGIGLTATSTSSEVVGLSLGFNNWGKKNSPNSDFFMAQTAAQTLNKSTVLAPFIAEGGAIEVDGEGTMLATESSILNPNRNPGIDKPTMERYLQRYLGVEKVIWIPGRRGWDITDDHIDALARFPRPGVVLLSKPCANHEAHSNEDIAAYEDTKKILSSATDSRGRALTIIDVPEPNPKTVFGQDFHHSNGPLAYVNYLIVNGGVIMAKFGDAEYDNQAARIIGEQFPGRIVEQVYLHQVVMGGGGIHCATQHIIE